MNKNLTLNDLNTKSTEGKLLKCAIARITVLHERNTSPDELITQLIKDSNSLDEQEIQFEKRRREESAQIRNKMYKEFESLRDRVAKLEGKAKQPLKSGTAIGKADNSELLN